MLVLTMKGNSPIDYCFNDLNIIWEYFLSLLLMCLPVRVDVFSWCAAHNFLELSVVCGYVSVSNLIRNFFVRK